MGSAAAIIAVCSFVSALLALFRDRLLAGTFGAGDELDIYYAAFRIPDFVAMVLVMGAISAAIIPIFSSYLARSEKEAFDFLSNLINVFFVSLILVSAVLIIFIPQLISLIAPGFEGEKKDLTILLSRIMFLSPVLLGISNIVSGVLRVFKRFLAASVAPIMYNIGIILGILFFVPVFGIKGLAFGVVLGGFLHLAIQMPVLLKVGFVPLKRIKFLDPGILKTIKLTIPRAIGLAAGQINLIVITAIGSTLAAGSVAVFNLAYNLRNLPINLIAISLSTAVFPFMSLSFSMGKKEELKSRFSLVFRQIVFLIVPISFLMFILRAQIIRIILGTGKFAWVDTRLTAACLGIFSIGVAAYGLSLLINKTFYAFHNTKIPAIVTLLTVGLNIALSYFFIWALSFENFFQKSLIGFLDLQGIRENMVVGLALALALSGIFQLKILFLFLWKKLGDFNVKEIAISMAKICLASFLLIAVSLAVRDFTASLVDMQTFLGIFLQAAFSALAGLLVYVLAALILKLKEINAVKTLIFRKINGN